MQTTLGTQADITLATIAANPQWRFLLCYGVNPYGRCVCWRTNCPRPAKHPLRAEFPDGFKSAHADVAQFREALATWPNANLALATGAVSGVDVVDLDGQSGIDALARWDPAGQGVPSFIGNRWCVRTPRGGLHVYFPHVEGFTSRQRIGGDPIDLRADGGFALLPPSVGVLGSYVWIPPRDPSTAWSPMPGWLRTRLAAAPTGARTGAVPIGTDEPWPGMPPADAVLHRRIKAYMAKVPPAVQGQAGHNQLLTACSALAVGFGLTQSEAAQHVAEYCARCIPPFTDRREIQHKMADAWAQRGNHTKPVGHLRTAERSPYQIPPRRRRGPAGRQ